MSEPAQEKWFGQTIHTYKPYWLTVVGGYLYEAHFECHDTPMLGKSPIKWRQHPDMTIDVDWDVQHSFKQTNKQTNHIFQYKVCELKVNLVYKSMSTAT